MATDKQRISALEKYFEQLLLFVRDAEPEDLQRRNLQAAALAILDEWRAEAKDMPVPHRSAPRLKLKGE